MNAPIEAYPLTWPTGRPRTTASARREAAFKLTLGRARDELIGALALLSTQNVVISSCLRLTRDGLPLAHQREPDDPGVAVYFDRLKIVDGRPVRRSFVIACDSYRRAHHNLRAIGVTVDALRTVARHGATELLEQAFSGFAALPAAATRDWWVVLGCVAFASVVEIKLRYREHVALYHPDKPGGDLAKMVEVNRAYSEALAARGAS